MLDDELPDDLRRDSSVSDSSECSSAILLTGLGHLGWTIRDVVSAVDAGPGTAAAATPVERPSRYSSSEMNDYDDSGKRDGGHFQSCKQVKS